MNQPAKKKDLKYLQTRNFLFANVERFLENVSILRENRKNDSEDLFGSVDMGNDSSINWLKNYPNRSKLEVLASEKDSLGIYVSGNPLQDYKEIESFFRDFVYREDLFLILTEKVKKIFTKTNRMMFALDITTTEDKYEGIIFPKKALDLSPIVKEHEIFWVNAKVIERKKKKKEEPKKSEQLDNGAESTLDTGEEMQEFEELPKLAIDNLVPFEEGVIKAFKDIDLGVALNKRKILENFDWEFIKENPLDFIEETQTGFKNSLKNKSLNQSGESTKKDENIGNLMVIKIPKSFGSEKLKMFKSKLKKAQMPGLKEIAIEIEKNGEWKKAKGSFWIDPSELIKMGLVK